MDPTTESAAGAVSSNPQQQPEPDIMNDPAYTPTPIAVKGQEEVDTCRICRGDGSAEEPLFHPCKCSGSIKYVHQECLMEWLSHSQKKYCELCKTPFRFTKLYHPHMPRSLPNMVFLRRAAVHVLNALVSWFRGILVISIWSVWLPWSMRYAWSGLFWIGDGRWNQDLPSIAERLNAEHQLRMSSLNATAKQSATPSPSTVQMPGMKELFGLVGMLVFGNYDSVGPSAANSTLLNATATPSPFEGRNSLLSDWKLLHDVTPEFWLNKLVMDTMEGQIITLSVVVGFILIFLIREWVVQQQPALNLGAFQAEAENFHDRQGDNVDAGNAAAEAGPGLQHQPLPTDAPQPTGGALQGAVGAKAGDFLADADLEPLEPSSEVIDALFGDLQRSSGTLQWMVRPDCESFQGTQDDLQAARDVMMRTRRLCATVKRQAKLAIDSGETADARVALDYLSRLQEALTYLPWRDENELASIINDLQAYISTAYELLTMQENNARRNPGEDGTAALASSSQNTAENVPAAAPESGTSGDLQVQSTESATSEPLLDIAQLSDSQAGDVPLQTPLSDLPDQMPVSKDSSQPPEVTVSAPREDTTENHEESTSRASMESDSSLGYGHNGWSFVYVPKQPQSGGRASEEAVETALPPSARKRGVENFDTKRSASDTATMAPKIGTPDVSEHGQHDHEVPQQRAVDIERAMSSRPSPSTPPEAAPVTPSSRSDQTASASVPSPPLLASDSGASPPVSSDDGNFLQASAQSVEAQPTQPTTSSGPVEASQAPQMGDQAVPMAEEDVTRRTPDALPKGWLERFLDLIFGDLVPAGPPADRQANEEHIVQDIAAEAPFVPFNDNRPDLNGEQARPQPVVARRAAENAAQAPAAEANAAPGIEAAQAANVARDAEAIEEAEDIEGILELIGMQGPISGLFQNAVFAAVLVTATIALSILLPYVCGKLVLIVLADPVSALNVPLQLISGISNFLIDVSIVAGGACFAAVDYLFSVIMLPLTYTIPGFSKVTDAINIGNASSKAADAALARIVDGILTGTEEHAQSQPSLIGALPALRVVQAQMLEYYTFFEDGVIHAYNASNHLDLSSWSEFRTHIWRIAKLIGAHFQSEILLLGRIVSSIPAVFRSGQLVLSLGDRSYDIALLQARDAWSVSDRVATVFAGYASCAFAGALYVRRRTPFSTSEHGRRTEQIIKEVFLQAAGVLKVILIIGIEMLVFPLYCGFLLDTAMLPLFPDTTLASRISFTKASVYSSVFFHWFVGTCYMFHFALYVSMCRKIFRRGVLYFIRDPDDPSFHPVRDVLERSVSSQLCKIGFSALVYGGLVILCMGSVVWAVAFGVPGVLPLRWTRASYSGYPIDFILYYVLAPMAVHLIRPSKGIQLVYEWWFEKSARALRLSLFLFNKPDGQRSGQDTSEINKQKDGRYVRAPASDSVRLPRGRSAFLEVDEQNNRLDQQQEPEDSEEAHAPTNEQYAKVWIPPYFKVRIGIFVFMMWVLTAMLGLSATVVPLMCGRWALARFVEESPNDLYAYVIGLCPFVFAYYSEAAALGSWKYIKTHVSIDATTLASTSSIVRDALWRVAKVTYIYAVFAIVAPTLLALILECYFIIPLQSYSNLQDRPAATHAIRYLQDWTMGMMYLRVAVRTITLYSETRAARGLQAIVARGYVDPDVRIATRCFILPFVATASTLLGLPIAFSYLSGWILRFFVNAGALKGTTIDMDASRVDDLQVHMNRLAYPLVLASVFTVWGFWLLKHAARRWRLRIRDEIYLIGERLHNFGEARPGQAPASGAMGASVVEAAAG